MIPYTLIRSGRKTLALQVTGDLEVIVRAPLRFPRGEIDRFVCSRQAWIYVQQERLRTRAQAHPEPSEDELQALKQAALSHIPARVAHWAQIMGLQPAGIKITQARTRFGSCSSRNSLCFSCRLMGYPPEAVDYVVVHELAHICHKNHGPQFWGLVEQYLPDYLARRALLRE